MVKKGENVQTCCDLKILPENHKFVISIALKVYLKKDQLQKIMQ
jgi:hypothetical protein